MKQRFTYLCEIQFLGFRLHGWAKQPGVKTVHHMVDRTLRYVLDHDRFKSMGGSRTDARVSAEQFPVQLFMEEPLEDVDDFISAMNINLPADIKMLACRQVRDDFNIIQAPRLKEYHYYFYYGPDKYPFAAAHMSYFPQLLNIDIMQSAARLFTGRHDFKKYVTQPSKGSITTRTITECGIEKNRRHTGSVFPPESFVLKISSQGFMRHQIRLMMGQLILLGRGERSMTEFHQSFHEPDESRLDYIAPGSGLILHRTFYSEPDE